MSVSDPSLLNRFLSAHRGFDTEGLLQFDRVADIAPRRIQLAYEGPASLEEIDGCLRAGRPVIVQLTLFSGDRHFVVVMGKQGYNYLVRDPAADPGASLVRLDHLAPRIEQQYVYLSSSAK